MAINLGDLATVVDSSADGRHSDGSGSGTFCDVRPTGAGGNFPAGNEAHASGRKRTQAIRTAIAAKRGAADRALGGGAAPSD